VDERVVADVRSGRISVILVTSGSVADQVARQFGTLPSSTVVAAIGPRTAKDARAAGLDVAVVSRQQTVTDLIDSVVDAVADREVPPVS
jgi:uroporphyrinogen-III synthase